MFQYIAAGDAIERLIGKWQPCKIGRKETRAAALQSPPRPAKHLGRNVATGDRGIAIGVFEQVLDDLSRPAADIENALSSAEIESPPPHHPIAQGGMQRQKTTGPQDGAFGAGVDTAHLIAIFRIADLLPELRLNKAIE